MNDAKGAADGRTAALRVEGLGVSYGALVALQGVDWEVHPGEILGIIGPNGAGKSSCYDATTNMVRHRGRVLLYGEDVTDVPPHRLADMGLKRAFQQNAFFGDLSVVDNVIAALQDAHGTNLIASVFAPWRELSKRQSVHAEATALLERFGVPRQMHDLKPGNIPYGIQRMLSIALAHGAGARVLMLDEPAAGLGGDDMRRLRDLLISLKRDGLALVVVEHHMDLIMSVADRIVVIDQGRPLAVGTPHAVQSDERVLEAYLGRT